MKAIIYKATKNVMQSGQGKLSTWLLEYDEAIMRAPESLNGWTATNSTTGQVQLKFESQEQAENFAKNNNLEYRVKASHARKVRPRNYSDNFKYIPADNQK